MGRTSRANPREKRKTYPLRLANSERAALEENAISAGMKLSEYLRWAGLKKHLRPRVPEINRQIYVELGRIGNNLNQMTRACHVALKQGTGCNIDPALLQSLSESLDQVRLAVIAVAPEAEDDWETD